MALEAVVYAQPQDHFGYGPKVSPYTLHWCDMAGEPPSGEWDPSLLASLVQSMGEWEHWEGNPISASPERDAAAAFACAPTTPTQTQKRKRRRTKNVKDKEEAESQRMTHIAVERNRRRQMNEYLAMLRSLMPPSYAQRGDQASIVGGAINYVRELEQLLQSLEVQKSRKGGSSIERTQSPFASFFTSPQYSTSAASHGSDNRDDARKIEAETMVLRPAAVVDIEASIVEGHTNVKVQAPRRPRQLLKLATGFQRLGLTILHLNVTTADAMVLYSFSLKMEDESKLGSVEEIAAAVHEILGRIQEDAVSP